MGRRPKTIEEHKRDLLAQLPQYIRTDPRWKDYVKEAEHQEGLDYWHQFGSIDEVVKDFDLFCDALN